MLRKKRIVLLDVIVVFVVFLGLMDLYLTSHLINSYNMEEANPILKYVICNFGFGSFVCVKLAVTAFFGATYLLCKKSGFVRTIFAKSSQRIAVFLLFVVTLLIYMFVVGSQLYFMYRVV